MATNFNIVSYTGNEQPLPNQYPTERAYAQAYQEWGNRRNTEKLKADFAKLSSDDNQNSGTQNSVSQSNGDQNSSNVGQTGQKGNSQTAAWPFPGKRPKNILGDYSSYTYSLSLYMVTPEYLNDYVAAGTGILPPGNGIFVVAQSGGINNAFDQRLITKSGKLGKGQQGLDFYIDDLDLTTVVPGGANQATTSSDIRFKIVEPNGFTFLTDLSRASSALVGESSLLGASDSKPAPPDQKFILGIRFFGYDAEGNLVKTQSKLQTKSNSSYSDAYSIAERFIAIRFSTLKFKLDGKATVYNIEAAQESEQNTFGQVNSTLVSNAPLVASGGTVREAIEGTSSGNTGNRGLLQFLNESQEDLKRQGKIEIPTVYKVAWIDSKDGKNPIPDAKLVDDKDVETRLAALSPGQTTNKVNVSESFKAAVYNPTSRQVTFAAGTAIAKAIDNLIVKSTYVTDAINQVNNGKPETDTKPNASGKQLQWYSINPVTKVLGRDEKTRDWAYEITYEISVYDLPFARTQYKSSSPKYPGPFKYYSFMLTGENTEVLEYEQSYDNLYFTIETASTSPDTTTKEDRKKVGTPIHVQGGSNSDPTGGKLYKGSEINDNVRAQLYSETNVATSKIKILGDPDFIMTQVGISQSKAGVAATDSAQSVYGPDFSINPASGQTFIQIVFNVASDYDDSGLMDVSDKIQFYESNDVQKAGIKGVVYQVTQVQSSFSRGSFTQLLDCTIVPEDQLVTTDDGGKDKRPEPSSSGGAADVGNGVDTGVARRGRDDLINEATRDSLKYNDADYAQTNYDDSSQNTPVGQTSNSHVTRPVSYAQESAIDDQRTVNEENVASIYKVNNNPNLTPEQNTAVEKQATVAATRSVRVFESLPGSTRTASGQRRFTRSAP